MEPRRRRLIEEHLLLVDHVVRKVTGSVPAFVDRQELLSAGRLGLTEAAIRYEFERDVPFAPFAARRIRGAVLDHLRADDWVPRAVRETARLADHATQRLHHRLGRSPEDSEVADAIGVAVGTLRDTRAAVAYGSTATLDAHGEHDEDLLVHLVDRSALAPDERLEQRELEGYVRAAVHHLPERLRLIVVGHYLEGRSLDELADLLGVTPSRVSQLRSDAIEMIRDGVGAQFTAPDGGRPKGRVAIRQAQFAAAVARHADWRTRLVAGRYQVTTTPGAPPGPPGQPEHQINPAHPAEDHVA